ncbi:hypothetical protein SAMN05428953_104334 [Mesorhizobium muleiense]|uniref:Uncharacterized protein n=2 Tax=Mesorhizobium muleiense TaxID=1004279 RepID=A0A1G8RCB1_9HYPH|nr:hypothetical protein [Mesorhizobium muleiense]SDJ14571.1 hypothetical protein SAMN05428953_104334 [Mesorhizobium muleiense]
MQSVHSVTYLSGSDTGILSPYSDGERRAVIEGFANHKAGNKSAEIEASPFLPVTIRGEMSGRTMRGGAGVDNWPEAVLSLAEDNI